MKLCACLFVCEGERLIFNGADGNQTLICCFITVSFFPTNLPRSLNVYHSAYQLVVVVVVVVSKYRN